MTSNAASTKHDTNIVTGLFEDKESAEAVYNSLRSRGYSDDEINVIMSDATRDKYFRTHPLGTKAAEGTALGGVLGGTLGAVVGGLAAVGSNSGRPRQDLRRRHRRRRNRDRREASFSGRRGSVSG
jgi:hypothetical protein